MTTVFSFAVIGVCLGLRRHPPGPPPPPRLRCRRAQPGRNPVCASSSSNPNATESMTATIARRRPRGRAGRSVEIVARHQPRWPAGDPGRDRRRRPLPALIGSEWPRSPPPATGSYAIVIACFDDTGLAEALVRPRPARSSASARPPLISPPPCSARRFSVVTTLAVSTPILEANIARYGLTGALGRVRASGVPVLDLERDPEAAAGAGDLGNPRRRRDRRDRRDRRGLRRHGRHPAPRRRDDPRPRGRRRPGGGEPRGALLENSRGCGGERPKSLLFDAPAVGGR